MTIRRTLTDADRRAVMLGEDLYVTILSQGAINPLFCTVGPVDWTRSE